MLSVLRILLLALLAVSLPLKGMASVATSACGELQQASSWGPVAMVDHAAMHHGANADIDADPAAAANEPELAVADTGTTGHETGHGDAGKLKCSSCAPCCAVGAPGFAAPVLAHADVAGRALQLEDHPLASVTIARLHRPPITHRA